MFCARICNVHNVCAALARNRRAASVVAASAFMAVLALAAIAINDSTERTELSYRSSLDPVLNPAAGSGKVHHGPRYTQSILPRIVPLVCAIASLRTQPWSVSFRTLSLFL